MSESIEGCNCKGDGCYTWFSPRNESGLCDRCETKAEYQQQVATLTQQAARLAEERDAARRENKDMQGRMDALMGKLSSEEAEELEGVIARMKNGEVDAESAIREAVRSYQSFYHRSCECREADQRKLRDVQSQLAAANAERDAALRQCAEWASQAGLAKGELMASEMAGNLRGWKERAERAEKLLASGEPCYGTYRQREDENDGKEFFYHAIWHDETRPDEGERKVPGVFIPTPTQAPEA